MFSHHQPILENELEELGTILEQKNGNEIWEISYKWSEVIGYYFIVEGVTLSDHACEKLSKINFFVRENGVNLKEFMRILG
ncbi:hypothetical protein [Natranaerobius trueperi]|uniref:Uncharacterized protein n=1 Tax=Natranaerobius trueperi TaxID=759412 RepID=A0A226BZM9_9FIRM|nr:hypothetical protein [Natranaerobius trueperi]OWZ84381.1 hypothetical protein CDO51_03720 [Natranaerobius trueperi]